MFEMIKLFPNNLIASKTKLKIINRNTKIFSTQHGRIDYV